MKGDKFKSFLDKNGFYILVVLALVTIIGTATFLPKNKTQLQNDKQYAKDKIGDTGFEEFDIQDVSSAGKKSDALGVDKISSNQVGAAIAQKQETKAKTKPKSNTASKSQAQPKKQKVIAKSFDDTQEVFKQQQVFFADNDLMQWPVQGKIVMGYSMKKLIYDPTLEQARTHDGVCIAAKLDEQVHAGAKGKVKSIKESPKTGVTVVLDHGNGWQTKYGELQGEISVKEGQIVEKGDVLGKVGKPCKTYSRLSPHVFFQVVKAGETMNPSDITKEKLPDEKEKQ